MSGSGIEGVKEVLDLACFIGRLTNDPACVCSAAYHGKTDIVKMFLERGADPCARDPAGKVSLHFSAKRGDLEITKLLIDAHADVEAVTEEEGYTPLHIAAMSGKYLVVEVLLKANSDVNARSKMGETPLFLSALKGRAAVFRLLLHWKANPQLKAGPSRDTLLPVQVAMRSGHVRVVEAFRDEIGFEESEYDPLLLATLCGVEILKVLLGAGVPDYHGTALSSAVSFGNEEVVKLLLSASKNTEDYVNGAHLDKEESILESCFREPEEPKLNAFSCRILRRILDAGLFVGTVYGEDAVSFAERKVEESRNVDEDKALRCRGMHRLLLQVPAVHALSWGWPTDDVVLDEKKSGVLGVRWQRATKTRLCTVLMTALSRKKNDF